MLFVALSSGTPGNLNDYQPLLSNSGLSWQLTALGGWQTSLTCGMENAAGVRAVKALKESGHPEAVRFCGTKKVGTTAFTSCRCCPTAGAPDICPCRPVWGGSSLK